MTLLLILLSPTSVPQYRFAQLEMVKYQLQASHKWSFDFIKESPITHASSQFQWETSTLNAMPKFYHHISHPTRLTHQPCTMDANDHSQLFSEYENICPLTRNISSPSIIIQNPLAVNKLKIGSVVSTSTSFAASTACSNQRKITGEWCTGKMRIKRCFR